MKAGKVRSIGLSNYQQKTFDEIMKIATITLVLVQNEVHPYNQDNHTKAYLAKFGTQMEAWYPLGGRNSYGEGGKETLFADPVIAAIAKAHNKTPAQILLRWQLQAGNIAIPGSSNPDHIKENISIFDFAPEINRYLQAHLFGDVFASDLLNWQEREVLTLGALGADPLLAPQYNGHKNIGKHNGLTNKQIVEIEKLVKE